MRMAGQPFLARLWDRGAAAYVGRNVVLPPHGPVLALPDPLPCPPQFNVAYSVELQASNRDPVPPRMVYWVMEPGAWRVNVHLGDDPPEAPEHAEVIRSARTPDGETGWFIITRRDGTEHRSRPPVPKLPRGDGSPVAVARENIEEREPENGDVIEPRGTILVLQGWGDSVLGRPYLRPLACVFADAGYRVICPDLRGMGLSQGRLITHGRLEVDDIHRLIDDLEEKNLISGLSRSGDRGSRKNRKTVGIIAHSYGGSIAFQAAAVDDRIAAIASLAASHDLRETLQVSVRAFRPKLRWALTDRSIDWAVTLLGRHAGIDPDKDTAELAIRGLTIPVLLIHGDHDPRVPLLSAQRLQDARPAGTELIVLRGETHTSFLVSRFDWVCDTLLGWMRQALVNEKGPSRFPGQPQSQREYPKSVGSGFNSESGGEVGD